MADLKTGTAVELSFDDGTVWVEGVVLELLSTQFTVDVAGHTAFQFYRDEGITWRVVE